MLESKLWYIKTVLNNVTGYKDDEINKTCAQYLYKFKYSHIFSSLIVSSLEKKGSLFKDSAWEILKISLILGRGRVMIRT